MMKLLMISGDRSVLEGKHSAFWYTLQGFRKHWDRIDIICPRPDPAMGLQQGPHEHRPEGQEGGEVFFHASPDGLRRQKKWIVETGAKLIEEHGHDVMTVHDYPPFYNGMGARALHKETGIPYALEIHHIVGVPKAADMKERIGALWSKWYFPRAAVHAAAVRTVNNDVSERLIAYGIPRDKISVVPSFYLDRPLIESVQPPPVAYDMAFCARLVPNKGLMEVIEAAAKIPDARLLIIGDGPERPEGEKKMKALGLEGRVTFAGWLDTQEAVLSAITSSRTFIVHSSSEGGPRVGLEAMACGVPVVTTRVGIMTEVIEDGENGLFTDGSVDDLVAKVQLVLGSSELQEKMSYKGKLVLDRFDREVLLKGYADFLKEIAVSSNRVIE